VEKHSFLSILISIIIYLISGEIFLSLGIGAISFCLIILGMNNRKIFDSKIPEANKLSDRLLIIYPLFHIISLFSSSFIEEEHQCWYYLLSTYLLLITIEEKSFQNLFMLILSRVIRSWNQTGNKWLHLNDIGDFFNA
jgi:ethanolaminephosphotransferase